MPTDRGLTWSAPKTVGEVGVPPCHGNLPTPPPPPAGTPPSLNCSGFEWSVGGIGSILTSKTKPGTVTLFGTVGAGKLQIMEMNQRT